jgi:hypothetical protein
VGYALIRQYARISQKKHLSRPGLLWSSLWHMGINADMLRSTVKQIAKRDQPSKAKSRNDGNTARPPRPD